MKAGSYNLLGLSQLTCKDFKTFGLRILSTDKIVSDI